jgi:adenylate cyclase
MTAAALVCGSCGTELSAKAKFCGECGAAVATSTTPAEYKQVTVLFAEVVIPQRWTRVTGNPGLNC